MNEMQGSTRKKKVGNSSESWGGDESEDDDENEEEEDYSDEGEEDDPSLTDMETMNMDPFADILEKISQRVSSICLYCWLQPSHPSVGC